MTLIADTHYRSKIWIGGKAGMTMSRVAFSPSVEQGWLKGTTGAVTVRYSEEKLFGIVGELGWSTRGWNENFEEAPLHYSRTLTYIDLPIMTQIIFGKKRFKTFINLGPVFSMLIGQSTSANFDYHNPLEAEGWPAERNRMTDQFVEQVKKGHFDYGICGSLGFEFYVQPRHSVTVEGRYFFGLGNIFPATKADTFGASRNNSIQVTIGYNFLLR